MTTLRIVYLIALLFVAKQCAQSIDLIWLSPTNVSKNAPEEFPERYVWSNISIGAGSRNSIPLLLMDSNKTLWIMFGNGASSSDDMTSVWNYDPMTDLYRWVAGSGTLTSNRNPGQLGVPSETNSPGRVYYTIATIDHNDMIWFFTTQYCCELWTFNTSSYLFTRMQDSVEAVQGTLETACFVTDSSNNLWLLGGITMGGVLKNQVWHLNTTSMQWTFVSGNTTSVKTVYGDNPLYGGRQFTGCDIDNDDRVWLFGGEAISIGNFDETYSDVWSFDTRTTQWQLERGSATTTVNNGQTVVSNDFHPDNNPSARQSSSVLDRKDGTLIVAGGLPNDVWLFHKTLKQWKIVHSTSGPGNYSHYRAPGSVMPSRLYQGAAHGLNVNGDLFMLGGFFYNDLWLIPFDQCSNNGTYLCGSNAHCVDEMIGYSCACDTGFPGDGLTCTAIPQSLPVPEIFHQPPTPPTSPISVLEPISLPVSAPESKSVVSSASSVISVLAFFVILSVL